MLGLRPTTKVSVFILFAALFSIGIGSSISSAEDSFEDEVVLFSAIKSDDEMAGNKKMHHFFRSGRYVLSRMQEQQTAFLKKNGGDASKVNKAASKAEELMNEANMMASQGEYKDGIKLLVEAHNILVASLKEIR